MDKILYSDGVDHSVSQQLKIEHYREGAFIPDLHRKSRFKYDGTEVEVSTVELRVAHGMDDQYKYETMVFAEKLPERRRSRYDRSEHIMKYEYREMAKEAHEQISEICQQIDPRKNRMPAEMHIQKVARDRVEI